jgi:hypothetical protein
LAEDLSPGEIERIGARRFHVLVDVRGPLGQFDIGC